MHSENTFHKDSEFHHHHSHAEISRHISGAHILQIEGLNLSYTNRYKANILSLKSHHKSEQVLNDVNLSVHANEIIALVGESGSGKTSIAKCVVGAISNKKSAILSGEFYFDGNLCDIEKPGISDEILYIPQGITALDPTYKYKIKNDDKYKLYPKNMSGGMAKKALINHAFSLKKDDFKLIIADEPTDGLDDASCTEIMNLLRSKITESSGMILITHDIDIALKFADRIAIIKDGHIVEETSTSLFKKGELNSQFARDIYSAMPKNWNFEGSLIKDTICIFGDTGTGKSTIAKQICGYEKNTIPDEIAGKLPKIDPEECEMIFQDPYTSFPPNSKICKSFEREEYYKCNTFDLLKIDMKWMDRYPCELSGGQLQKLSIFKTLQTNPKCLIADEATSMCDGVTQKEIFEALLKWCKSFDCEFIFITHNKDIRDKVASKTIFLNKLQD